MRKSQSYSALWLDLEACGILIPEQGSNSCPMKWKCKILTTGWPSKSLPFLFICASCLNFFYSFKISLTAASTAIWTKAGNNKYMWHLKEPSFQIICSIALINSLVRCVVSMSGREIMSLRSTKGLSPTLETGSQFGKRLRIPFTRRRSK